jgi:hypothetical protein
MTRPVRTRTALDGEFQKFSPYTPEKWARDLARRVNGRLSEVEKKRAADIAAARAALVTPAERATPVLYEKIPPKTTRVYPTPKLREGKVHARCGTNVRYVNGGGCYACSKARSQR